MQSVRHHSQHQPNFLISVLTLAVLHFSSLRVLRLAASCIAFFLGVGSYSNIFDETAGPVIFSALAVTFAGSKLLRGRDPSAELATLVSLPWAGIISGVVATVIEGGGFLSVFFASGISGALCWSLPIYFLISKDDIKGDPPHQNQSTNIITKLL